MTRPSGAPLQDQKKGRRLSDIFEEVEESLAAEKTSALWKKYWPFIAAVVAAIILGVGADSYLKHQREQRVETSGRAFEAALKAEQSQDIEAVRRSLADVAGGKTGFADLAGHYLAGAELRLAGDETAAYDALDATAQGEGPLANMARLKAAYILADTASLSELEAYVAPLIESESAFAPLAREVVAAKAVVEGDYDKAKSEYNFLTLSMDAPQGVRNRATQILAVIPSLVANQQEASTTAPEEASSDVETEPTVTAVEE